MTTYIVGFDTRAPDPLPAIIEQLTGLRAVEIWPGFWVLSSDLSGQPLRDALNKVFNAQGYVFMPYSGEGTTSVGISGGGPASRRAAFADLLAAPLTSHLGGGLIDMGEILSRVKTLPEGQAAGFNSRD